MGQHSRSKWLLTPMGHRPPGRTSFESPEVGSIGASCHLASGSNVTHDVAQLCARCPADVPSPPSSPSSKRGAQNKIAFYLFLRISFASFLTNFNLPHFLARKLLISYKSPKLHPSLSWLKKPSSNGLAFSSLFRLACDTSFDFHSLIKLDRRIKANLKATTKRKTFQSSKIYKKTQTTWKSEDMIPGISNSKLPRHRTASPSIVCLLFLCLLSSTCRPLPVNLDKQTPDKRSISDRSQTSAAAAAGRSSSINSRLTSINLTFTGNQNKRSVEGKRQQSLIFEGLKFLETYGYLPNFNTDDGIRALMSDESVRDAIKTMQKFGNVDETGELDGATLALMRSPRCGRPDVESHGYELIESPTRHRGRLKRFTVYGNVWTKNFLTYCFVRYSRHMYWGDQEDATRRAFHVWASHSLFSFALLRTKNCFGADIKIDFGGRAHGDVFPFDGPNLVLAHAFAPGDGLGGDIHFDEDEAWVVGSDESYEFFTVAVHEIGHSLGLGHTPSVEAVMTPYYKGYQKEMKLGSDDINGIQKRYSEVRDGTVVFKPRVGDSNNPYYPPESPPLASTQRPTTTPKPEVDIPVTCDTDFDAASVVRFWEVFFFKGKYFWRVQKETMTYGPFKMATFWTQYPEEKVDAVYEKPNGNLMFFNGQYFWEFDGVQLVRGPVRLTVLGLPPHLEKIDAAFVWQFKRDTYFFAQKSFWKFDEKREKMVYGYPKSVSEWKGVPAFPVDAVIQGTDDNIYFIQGIYYWVYSNIEEEVVDGPLTVSSQWTKCEGKERLIPDKRPKVDKVDKVDNSSIKNKISSALFHSIALILSFHFLIFYNSY